MRLTRIVTFLGLGQKEPPYYDPAAYRVGDAVSPTTVLDDAALAWAARRRGDAVSLIVLGTAEVRDRWFGADGRYARALREIGLALQPDSAGARLGFREIPRGRDEGEARDIFDAVLRALRREPLRLEAPGLPAATEPAAPSEIVVAITHGFRSQPFFAAAAIAHAQQVAERRGESDPPIRIAYAAYERERHGPDAAKPAPAPILDLDPFLRASRFSGAIRDLMRFGRADTLEALLAREQARLFLARSARGDGAPPRLKALGTAARSFCDAMATLRTGEIMTTCAPNLARAIAAARADVLAELPALAGELDALVAWADGCAAREVVSPAGLRAAVAIARIYLDHQRYAEAVGFIREALITAFTVLLVPAAERIQPGAAGKGLEGDADEAFKAQRKGIAAALSDLAHGREPAALGDGGTGAPGVPRGRGAALPPVARDLAGAYRDIQNHRNDVLHAAFRGRPLPAKAVRDWLDKSFARVAPLLERVAALAERTEAP